MSDDQWPEWADEITNPIIGRPMYYSRRGEPISFRQWTELRDEHKRVAYTEIGEVEVVSTVWLGIDHNFFGGPPLIFETVVFGGPFDMTQKRYSTEAQALAGHDQMVARVRQHGD